MSKFGSDDMSQFDENTLAGRPDTLRDERDDVRIRLGDDEVIDIEELRQPRQRWFAVFKALRVSFKARHCNPG